MIDAFDAFPAPKKIVVVALGGAALAGWMMNIWSIVVGGESLAISVWRLAGVPLWPLGAILGWL